MKENNIADYIKYSKDYKVLYAEDNQITRNAFVKLLQNFFDDITICADGKEALDKFQKNKYDLVISDINMPVLDGIKLLEEIRKLDKDIIFVIISAHHETPYFIDAIKYGVDCFLLKPVNSVDFLTLMNKTIKRIKDNKENEKYLENEKKLASLGKMLDTIAHQWKQPLNSINFAYSTLSYYLEKNLPMPPEELNKINLVVEQSSQHLIETLDEFRTFFRENKEIECTNINELIVFTIPLLKTTLDKNHINFSFNGDETLTANLFKNEFKHVLLNLINNSIDAFISSKRENNKNIDINIFKKDTYVYLTIKDNAGGIPQNIINKVFEYNFTTKSKDKGTGIGLDLCKQIVEKVNGTIEVENDSDGAVFTIKLPKC